MEDLIIYGAGALAVRGARRMFFGPSRETRLAQQVEHLSTQVAEQARMIEQLQTQGIVPQSQHTGVSPGQHLVHETSRSGGHQPLDFVTAVAPSAQGASRGKRSGSPAWHTSHGAKRARHAAPVQAAAAGGDESSSSKDDSEAPDSETPNDSGPSERSLSLPPPEEDESSTSEEPSSSEGEEESASESDASPEVPLPYPESSDSESEDSSSSDSEEEEVLPVRPLPILLQEDIPSSSEDESWQQPDSGTSSEDISLESDEADEASTSESEEAPERSVMSASCDMTADTVSSDSDGSVISAEVASPQQLPPGSQVSNSVEALEEPADNTDDISSKQPGPAPAGHSQDADESLDAPVSFPEQPHAARSGEAASEQAADAAEASQAEHTDSDSASKRAASGTKRSRDSLEGGPAQPEPKRRRSVLQKCSAALSGWLFSSTPATASSAAGASADPVPAVPKDQEIHSETSVPDAFPDAFTDQEAHAVTSTAKEVLQSPEAAVSEEAPSEGGQGPSAPAEPSFEEALSCDEAVSEEPAGAVAAPEAQHVAEPIATGVFAQGDWTDDQFVKELDSIFDNDGRLKAGDSSLPHRPVQDAVIAAETPALHGLPDPVDEEPDNRQSGTGTGEVTDSPGTPQEPDEEHEADPSTVTDNAAEDTPERSPSPERPAIAADSEAERSKAMYSRFYTGPSSIAPLSSESPSHGQTVSPLALNFLDDPRIIFSPMGSCIIPSERAGSPHSDRRRGLQSRTPSPSPSPSPRRRSPSPARRGRRSMDHTRSASSSESPRRGRSYTPYSSGSGRRRSPDTPRGGTPSYPVRRGRSGSATPQERSPAPERSGRRSHQRRSSPSARSMTPDAREDEYESPLERVKMHVKQTYRAFRHQDSRSPSVSSQGRSPDLSAPAEELSPVSEGTPPRSPSDRRAQRSPSPAREYYSPAERSMSRKLPQLTPSESDSDSGSPSVEELSEGSPSVEELSEGSPSVEELPADPSVEELSAESPPKGGPAQARATVENGDEAESPAHSADSVSAELEQQACSPSPERSPSAERSPAVTARSRGSSPSPARGRSMGDRSPSPAAAGYPSSHYPQPSRGRRMQDRSPSPAAPAHSHSQSRSASRGRRTAKSPSQSLVSPACSCSPSPSPSRGRAAKRGQSPGTSDSPSMSPPHANGRRSAERSQSPVSARSPTTEGTPPIKGNSAAERSSMTPDTSIERPRSPLLHRSPTPAARPGPSADFWRNQKAAARTAPGSTMIQYHQPDSPEFLFGAQPQDSPASGDDTASKEGHDLPANSSPSPPGASPNFTGATESPPQKIAGEPISKSRHVWPKAAQGPSSAAGHDNAAGEESEEDVEVSCSPAWERKAARSGRSGSHSGGSEGPSTKEVRAERSPSPATPRAQRTPDPERSGGSQAVSHGRSASSHSTSHGRSGSQRSGSSGGNRHSASPHGEEVSSHMTGPELSGFQRSHRRRRCGPGRRALGAIMRTQRRFIGGWRHRRHRRGSHSRGRSSSPISEPIASGDEEIIGAAQPEASQDARPIPGAADASPQLRAPPGRARGVLLPRSTSPTPEAEDEAEAEAIAPLWDPVIYEKSKSEWEKAIVKQERHMREMAARREQDRAAAKAKEAAAAEAQHAAAHQATLAAREARRAAARKERDAVLAAIHKELDAVMADSPSQPYAGGRPLGGVRPPTMQTPPARPQPWAKLLPAVQRPANHTQLGVQRTPDAQQTATRTQLGTQRAPIVQFPAFRTQLWAQGSPNAQRAATRPQMQGAPLVQRTNSHSDWHALMAAACNAGGAPTPIRHEAEAPKFNFRPSRPLTAAAGPSTTFPAARRPSHPLARPTQNSAPQTESLIDLTVSE